MNVFYSIASMCYMSDIIYPVKIFIHSAETNVMAAYLHTNIEDENCYPYKLFVYIPHFLPQKGLIL